MVSELTTTRRTSRVEASGEDDRRQQGTSEKLQVFEYLSFGTPLERRVGLVSA